MIVTSAKRRVSVEDARRIDDAMDAFADAVFEKLRDELKRGTVFTPGQPLPVASFGITEGFAAFCFRGVTIKLLRVDKVDHAGHPITVASGGPSYGFCSYDLTISLPWLDATGRLLPYVKKFAARHTFVHEAEHALDLMKKSAYHPDEGKMSDDHKLAWYERETEFNALWRQVVTSVRMLLRTIDKDAKLPVPKMKRALIIQMFSAFKGYPKFRSAIADSMLGKKTPAAIFEFNGSGHFQELASRCLDTHNVYKYHREFDARLRELHREVIAWFETYAPSAQ